MEYKIIHARDTDQLIKLVNNLTTQGWEPVGGITFKNFENVFQVLVKKIPS